MLSLAALYQYQCQLTGVVKAYKQTTPQKAAVYNDTLEGKGALGRWVPQLVAAEMRLEGVREPLAAA